KKEALRGLTTAAGVWCACGVGMAAGAGMYVVATGATILVIAFQCLMHLHIPLFMTKHFYMLRIKFRCAGEENEVVKRVFHVERFARISFVTADDGILNGVAEIRTSMFFEDTDLMRILKENPFILSAERLED
ncbi:MAG: MgtC/SapB family protein, partial [Clostridiales bacterium]|nr:MgtC/SapB family protein [Clostridiales bacterium]